MGLGRFIESGGLWDHSDMFSWPRDIIFEVYKSFENFDFSESKISRRIFFIFHQKFHPRPTCTAIIGFPIVIALIPGNIKCCLEKSDWQKIRREILIIYFLKFTFYVYMIVNNAPGPGEQI